MSINQTTFTDQRTREIRLLHRRELSNGTKRLHVHTEFELLLILCGKYTIQNGGNSYTNDRPCMVIHRPGTYHGTIRDPGVIYEYYALNFSLAVRDFFSNGIADLDIIAPNDLTVIPLLPEELEEVLIYMHALELSKSNVRKRAALLAAMLCTAEEAAERNENGVYRMNAVNVYMMSVLRYVFDNYKNEITISDIAAHFHVSVSKLTADFKELTGKTIKDYITELRMEKARSMLLGGVSITDVAQRCGYCSDCYFIQVFKRHTGMPPGQYVKANKHRDFHR